MCDSLSGLSVKIILFRSRVPHYFLTTYWCFRGRCFYRHLQRFKDVYISCLLVRRLVKDVRTTNGRFVFRPVDVLSFDGRFAWRGAVVESEAAAGDVGSTNATDLFMIWISRHHLSLLLSLSSWRHCLIAICSSVSWKNNNKKQHLQGE